MEYLLHIAILVETYTILVISLDLLAGHTGMLSVAHAGFYGIGAYTSALTVGHSDGRFIMGVAAGMVVAALVSLVISLPSFRLRDDLFVIVTFGFQMILSSVLNNWVGLTRGPLGILGIPQPDILGFTVDSQQRFAILAAAFVILAYVVVLRITSSPLGRVLHAIREDEMLVEGMGKNVLRFKVVAFAVSAALAASAGSLYAHYVTYIDPTSFTLMESVLLISMVIIGGPGSPWGPFV